MGPSGWAVSAGWDGFIGRWSLSLAASTSSIDYLSWYPLPLKQMVISVHREAPAGWRVGLVGWYGKLTQDMITLYAFGRKDGDEWDLTLFAGVLGYRTTSAIAGIYSRWFF